jgi:hypothetical protein
MMDVDTALQLAPLIHMGKRSYWEKAVGSGSGSPKSGSKERSTPKPVFAEITVTVGDRVITYK